MAAFAALATMAALAVSACEGAATPTPISAEEILSSVNTAVALTAAFPSAASSTALAPAPSPAPSPSATPTLTQPLWTPTNVSYASAGACDGSAYVSDVTIPDGSILAPGETFTKTWRMKNTGACAWSSNYALIFSSGNRMSGISTPIEQTVAPGASAEISVELTAPDEEGTYTGYWILANSGGVAFGNYVYVQIVVSSSDTATEPAEEATETPEAVESPTPASTATPTAEATEETHSAE